MYSEHARRKEAIEAGGRKYSKGFHIMLVKYTRTSVFDEGAAQDGKEPTPTPARFDAEVAEALSDDLPGDRKPKFLYCHGKQDLSLIHI